MIAQKNQCLDKATLTQLLSGKLPTDRFSAALAHVDSCEHCTQLASSETADASSVGIGADLLHVNNANQDDVEWEAECQAMVANLLVSQSKQPGGKTESKVDEPLPFTKIGPYKLERTIGIGGMGAVYLGQHQRLRRRVAIKLLPREKAEREGWLDRFNREMTAIAALEHTNVVRALDAGEEHDWHYLVMEHLEGLDVSRAARRCGEISTPAACDIIRQAALGLGAIHDAGLVHRDIKPSNLFLTTDGIVKILDLGLVIGGQSPLASDGRLTTVGHLMGTLPYMPREQLNDARAADSRSDVYSLGATLFRLLSGKAPYGSGENLAQTIRAISDDPAPPLLTLRPDLQPELCQLVDSMISPDPAKRPESAQSVASALERFSNAEAAKSMIRAALLEPDTQDALPTGMTALPNLSASSTARKWRPWKWLAAAGVPLAFVAGIVLMIQTDRGTLIVESDEPSIAVRVTQGEELVQRLRIERGEENSVWLRSGRYRIEIEGADSDAFEIAGEDITLMRGDQRVVEITRRTEKPPATKNSLLLGDSSKPPAAHTPWANQDSPGATQTRGSNPFGLSWLPGASARVSVVKNPNLIRSIEADDFQPALYPSAVVEKLGTKEPNTRIQAFHTVSPSGFLFANPTGRVLRWFGDVSGNRRLDHWMYFSNGLPAYCEVDTNGNRHADQCYIYKNGQLVGKGADENGDRIAESLSGPFFSQQAEDGTVTHQTKTSGLRFENQPLDYWLKVLETDRDMATLSKAMQAVGRLAETPDERLRAAEQMLIPARELGGLIIGTRGLSTSIGVTPVQTSEDLSGWFMAELTTWFPKMYPMEGLRAINNELNSGTQESQRACLLLLSNLGSRLDQPPAISFYEQVATSSDGSYLLIQLDKRLDAVASLCAQPRAGLEAIPDRNLAFEVLAKNIAVRNRAAILTAQNRKLHDDWAIVAWARATLEQHETAYSDAASQMSSIHHWSGEEASMVVRALPNEDFPLTAIVNALLNRSHISRARRLTALQKLIEEKPSEVATAVLATLRRSASQPSQFSSSGGHPFQALTATNTVQLAALEVLQESAPDPIEALTAIAKIKHRGSYSGVGTEEAIDRLLVRAMVETDMANDPDAYARIVYAARGIAMRNSLSAERKRQSLKDEDAVAIYKKLADAPMPTRFSPFDSADSIASWPHVIDLNFDESAREQTWRRIHLSTYSYAIASQLPSKTIEFVLTRIAQTRIPVQEMHWIPPVDTRARKEVAESTDEVNVLTARMRRWFEFADTHRGGEMYATLIQGLIDALNERPNKPSSDHSGRTVWLLSKWLQLSRDTPEEDIGPVIVEALQSLTEAQLLEHQLPLRGLRILGRTSGYSAITPSVLNHHANHPYPSVPNELTSEELLELVDGVYEAHKPVFAEAFLQDGVNSNTLANAVWGLRSENVPTALAEVIAIKMLNVLEPAKRREFIDNLKVFTKRHAVDWERIKSRLNKRIDQPIASD